jgi:hypothetical protein
MSEEKESKLEKFERLAAKRATEVIKALQSVGNLSSKGSYEYTDDHVNQIFEAIGNELNLAKGRFFQQDASKPSGFSFAKKEPEDL